MNDPHPINDPQEDEIAKAMKALGAKWFAANAVNDTVTKQQVRELIDFICQTMKATVPEETYLKFRAEMDHLIPREPHVNGD